MLPSSLYTVAVTFHRSRRLQLRHSHIAISSSSVHHLSNSDVLVERPFPLPLKFPSFARHGIVIHITHAVITPSSLLHRSSFVALAIAANERPSSSPSTYPIDRLLAHVYILFQRRYQRRTCIHSFYRARYAAFHPLQPSELAATGDMDSNTQQGIDTADGVRTVA